MLRHTAAILSRSQPFDLLAQLKRAKHPDALQGGKPDQPEGSFQVKGKRLADSVEALIGVHCLHTLQQSPPGGGGNTQGLLPAGLFHAVEDACSFMSASHLLPPVASGVDLASLRSCMEAQASKTLGRDTTAFPMSSRELHLVEGIEAVMRFKFRNKFLAVQAVTHCSYQGVSWDSYQRQVVAGPSVPPWLLLAQWQAFALSYDSLPSP